MNLTKYIREETLKEVLILIGLPGSGKSTYIDKYLKGYTVISNDHVVEDYAKKNDISYTKAFLELDRQDVESSVRADTIKAAKTKTKVVIDNTNISVKRRNKSLVHFDDTWKKTAIVFKVSPKELRKRLDKRAIETGKVIPHNVITDMMSAFEKPTSKEFDVIKNV